MATIASLNIVFRGITGPLQTSTRTAIRTLKSVQSAVFSLSGAMASLGVGLSLKSFLEAAADSERQTKKLDAVLRATGGAAGFTLEQLEGMAAGLQKVTTFEDDATKGALAILLTFKKIQGPIFSQAVESAMDLSTVMEQDLKSSVMQIGKALNDPVKGITALQRAGVSFDATQKEAIKTAVESNRIYDAQKIILAELRSEFGGAAQADAKTMAGAIAQMKNAWGDLAEEIGGRVAPVVRGIAVDMKSLMTGVSDSTTASSAATQLSDIQKLAARRDELLKQRSDLMSKVEANAEAASGWSFFDFGASKAIQAIEIDSFASDLRTVNRELLMVEQKIKANKEFTSGSNKDGLVGAAIGDAKSVIAEVTSGISGMFDQGIIKAQEFSGIIKGLPDKLHEQMRRQGEVNKILEDHKQQWSSIADGIKSDVMTPLDSYFKRIGEIDGALNQQLITDTQAKQAEMQALVDLSESLPDPNRRAAALEFGTSAAFSAQLNKPRPTEKEILDAARRTNELLQKQLDAAAKEGTVVFGIP